MPRRRLFKKPDSWEYGHDTPAHERPLAEPKKRRAATTILFAALFFGGAAFTAVAGDRYEQISQDPASADAASADAAAADATTTDATTTDAAPSAAAPDPASADSSASSSAPAADAAAAAAAVASSDSSAASSQAPSDAVTPAGNPSAPADPGAASPSSDGQDNSAADPKFAPSESSSQSSAPSSQPRASHGRTASASREVPLHALAFPSVSKPAPAPEIEGPASGATVWLNRALPDPTPPAMRLSPAFARRLVALAKANGIDWALELAILRAKGGTGHWPAGRRALAALSSRLAMVGKHATGEWSAALTLDGSASFADKVQALARYDRAVGLKALVNGLEASKKALEQRILDDPSISIYPGGRNDIASGKVDVRVLALISYLHESFGEVTVSCLISGHRLYARPGVISAHIYGRAVDIAALGGTSILGHQEPGGLTEQAVRDMLLLPSEVMPKQIISLLGLGGPSFPLADHYNHIHIGY
jgi:hypothetical protein